MLNIMSRVEQGVRIATIINVSDFVDYRLDLCDESEALQVSGRCFEAGTFVPPHRHNLLERTTTSTAESWVVFSGRIECDLFDLDGEKLLTRTLASGDCVVLFNGGHSLRVLDKNTRMLEFKNGPYLGSKKDKEFL